MIDSRYSCSPQYTLEHGTIMPMDFAQIKVEIFNGIPGTYKIDFYQFLDGQHNRSINRCEEVAKSPVRVSVILV